MHNLSAENQLLLTLARTELTDDQLRFTQDLLQKQLDWDYILRVSQRNGVGALFYHHLSRFNGLVPVNIKAQLAKVAHTTGFYNLRYNQELEEILIQFNQAGIKVIILKGALLIEKLYKNIALRSMSDIDLLIKQEDFEATNNILNQLEFYRQDDYILGWHYGNTPYTKAGLGLRIDLHWHPAKTNNPFAVDVAQIWSRCKKVNIANTEAYTLSAEDMILLSCLHALFNHSLSIGLKAFCDLAEIINHHQGDIEWSYLTHQSIESKLGFVVYAGLRLTQRLSPHTIPQEVFERLKPYCSKSQLSWLEQKEYRILIVNNPTAIETPTRLKMITGIKDKIKLLRLIFSPPITELALHYSFSPDNRLAYCYYWLINLNNCLVKLTSKSSRDHEKT